jgi:hypothetical protein
LYNSVIRELNGRILGKIGNDFFEHYDENESWHDIKIAPEDIIFPKHNNTKPGPVKVYHISELKLK